MKPSDQKPSRIRPTIDFQAHGKHYGHLAIPYSRNDSAWGSMQLPIVVVAGGSGPTVLLTGGSHGDEYEGPIALIKLARDLDPARLAGRVIILPALNLPAVKAGTRLSPIDGANMNRAFPGSRDGTITSMIAHFVYTEILPRADVVLDIHSGGKTLDFVPCSIMHELEDRGQMERTLGALKAFGAPVGLVLVELDNEGMFDTAAESMGKTFISTELGGGGTVSTETVRLTDAGVRNVLRHFGVLDGEDAGPPPNSRLMRTPDRAFVSAVDSGIYEPLADLGSEVEEGQPIGRILFYERPDREPVLHRAPCAGMIVSRHFPGIAQMGDCLAVIGVDYA